jgi:hypothetical protein
MFALDLKHGPGCQQGSLQVIAAITQEVASTNL